MHFNKVYYMNLVVWLIVSNLFSMGLVENRYQEDVIPSIRETYNMQFNMMEGLVKEKTRKEEPKKTISEQEVPDTDVHIHGVNIPPEYVALKNPIPLTDESLMRGQEVYQRNCYRCHGSFGRGDGPNAVGLPLITGDLTDKERMAHHSEGTHFYMITHGVRKGKFMSPFGENLTENETWDLINYINTLH